MRGPTLAQLRDLDTEATAGPWEERDAVDEGAGVHSVILAGDRIVADTGRFPDVQAKHDARFILGAVAYVRSELAKASGR